MRGTRFWLFTGVSGLTALILAALGYFAFIKPLEATLRIGADTAGTESHQLAAAIAEAVARVHPDVTLEVVATAGTGDTMRLIADGKIDLAIIEADAVIRHSVSLIANLYPDLFQLLVRGESGIGAVTDLVGRRIAIPPVASGQFRAFWFLAGHYGVPPERLDAVPMSAAEAGEAILNGEVDALFRVAGPRNSQINQLVNRADLRLVAIDQGEAMHLRQPAYRAAILPKGAYRGDLPLPPEDLPTLAVDRLLIAGDAVDSEVVRAITGVLFENRRDLALRMPLANFIAQPAFDKGTPFPVHQGALDYYNREQPSVFEEKAEFFAFLLSATVVLVSLFVTFKRRFEERKKSRIEDYAAELLRIEKDAKAALSVPDLNVHKTRLTEILNKVVDDMRARRINAEGLQLFAFIWESVNYTVNDYEEQLRLGPGPATEDERRIAAAHRPAALPVR